VIYLEKKLSRLKNFLDVNSNSECVLCKKQITSKNKHEFIFQSVDNKSFVEDFYNNHFKKNYKIYSIYYNNKNINDIVYSFKTLNYIFFKNLFLLNYFISNTSSNFIQYSKEYILTFYENLNIRSKVYSMRLDEKSHSVQYILNPYYNDTLSENDIVLNLVNDITNNLTSSNKFKTTLLDKQIAKQLNIDLNLIEIQEKEFNFTSNKKSLTLPPNELIYSLFVDYHTTHNKEHTIRCNVCSGKRELKKAQKTYNLSIDNF